MFLFYWKPEDFAQSFGSDDQAQLENKLVSNFKSYGDLVLELLQKTKARSVALAQSWRSSLEGLFGSPAHPNNFSPTSL